MAGRGDDSRAAALKARDVYAAKGFANAIRRAEALLA
jgi:hypothetical protein